MMDDRDANDWFRERPLDPSQAEPYDEAEHDGWSDPVPLDVTGRVN